MRHGAGNYPPRTSVLATGRCTRMPGVRPLPSPPPAVTSVAIGSAAFADGRRLVPGRAARLLDPHRAELELRDLAHRVDLVDGQHVGGRLAEVERHEARPGRVAVR